MSEVGKMEFVCCVGGERKMALFLVFHFTFFVPHIPCLSRQLAYLCECALVPLMGMGDPLWLKNMNQR